MTLMILMEKAISMPYSACKTELKHLIQAAKAHLDDLKQNDVSVYLLSPPSPPPKPPIKPKTKQEAKEPAKPSTIALQPLAKPSTLPTDGKTLLTKLGISLIDTPPDTRAKRIQNKWKQRTMTIAILVDRAEGPERALLLNIAKAIDTLIAPCRIIMAARFEAENTWDIFLNASELKHIIAPDTVLTGNLRKHLRTSNDNAHRHLADKPLLLLPDLSLYLKDPLLKASLWKLLCQTLSPSS